MKSQSYASNWQTIVFVLTVALGLLGLPVNGWTATDCTAVTEIPQIECEALVALYTSTHGPNWTYYDSENHWNATNTPCSWGGIACNKGHITTIRREWRNLTGSIPPEIGNLTQLTELDLSYNQLSGSIPQEIGNLTQLFELLLEGNQLSGPIPPEIGNLIQLESFCLSGNQLSGSIPPEIGKLTQLYDLELNGNQLSGSIPPEIGNLTQLIELKLGDNQLSGFIPLEIIDNLTQLRRLSLSDNHLSGSIPPEIGNLTQLGYLDLSENQLSGSIPPEIGNLTQLNWLYLSNNQLSGSIPPEIGHLKQLYYLSLSHNELSGSIPLEIIDNLTQLTWLSLAGNQLSGPIPPEIGNLNLLSVLKLSDNQLSGEIPSSLNNLTNTIPKDTDAYYQTREIDLSFNCLTASDAELINFLNIAEPDWAENQTACESVDNNMTPILNPIGNKSIIQDESLTFTVTATDAENDTLEFGLVNAPTGANIDSNTGVFSWTPDSAGTFTVTITVTETDGNPTNLSAEETITITVTEPPPATCQNLATENQTLLSVDGKKGMTWGKKSHDDVLGVDYVNCSNCNAYSGETSCSSKLPILCLKKENLPDPSVYVPAKSPGVMQPSYYYGWTGGQIKLTHPVSGDALKGLTDANDICEFQFGTGYKMAEHHDGNGGWGWYAYGNIDDSSRFWVSINDQSSNCWGYGTGVSSARTEAQISELLKCSESATTQEPTTIDSEVNDEDSEKPIIEPEPTPELVEISTDITEIAENNTCQNTQIPDMENGPNFGSEFANIWWDDLGLEAFAIGVEGKIVHWENLSLKEMNSGTTHDLFGIWGPNSSDLFVVGNNGTMLHYDGSTWTTMNSGTEKHLYNLWGPANNNVFVVAQAGTIIHYNGSQWAPINSNTTNDLFGIWGSSANNIFAVGLNGTILHYDGNQWTTMDSPTTTDLFSIWGTSANDIYATSEDNSTIIHYEGSQWTELVGGGLGIVENLDDYPELSDELGELNGILDYGDLELNSDLGVNLDIPANNPNDCVNSNIEPIITEPTPEPAEIIVTEPIITEPTPEPAEIIVTDETPEIESIPEPVTVIVEENPDETPTPIEPVTTIDTTYPDNVSDDLETIIEEENSITVIEPDMFEPQLEEYPIVIKTMGTGIVTGEGINCGNDCTEIHARDSSITLTATPEEGSNFSGWLADCRGNNPSITITVDAALNCTAMFDVVPNRNLSINVIGEGSGTITAPVGLGNGIDCGKTCVENYPDGTTITLTAQPEIGSTFTGWIEKGCTEELTITNDMKCTATFELLPNYTLTVSTAEGNGTLITEPSGEVCGENCMRYVSDTEITVTAVPESDYHLLNWAGDCEGTTPSISFQLTTDMNCTAILEPKPTESTETDLESKSTESTEESTETDLESKPTESTETANDVVVIREELVPLPETIAIDAQGEVMRTEAGFAGGISVNEGETFEQEATLRASEPVNIQSQIVVDPEHVGQVTDVLVVAAYQPSDKPVQTRSAQAIYYYMLDIEGNIFPWNGEMANLIAFQSVKTLAQSLEVPIWDKPIGVTGKINIYFGYRLRNGTVIYSPQTLDVMITE